MRAVQGRFKDYIAMPSSTLPSLTHTTVIGPGGKPVEFRSATREMHRPRRVRRSPRNWGYKEQVRPPRISSGLQQLVAAAETATAQFMEHA